MLLHGFSGTHRTWDTLAERLAKNRFLVLPDLPGHGRSGTPTSESDMGIAATSSALEAVLSQENGGRRAAVVGYSLGGRVALALACRHKGSISSLVLEGASPGMSSDDERAKRRRRDDELADEIERRGIEWFVDHWEENPLFASQKELPNHAFESQRRDRLSNSAQGLASSLRAAGAGRMEPLWTEIERLTIPVLIVVGEKDAKYLELGEEMSGRIPASTLERVEGAGHCPHLERPREFAALVETFLAEHPTVMRMEGSQA